MTSFFFSQVDVELPFISELKDYAENNHEQTYVIQSPLGDDKYSYEYKDAIVVLCPKRKISFINLGGDKDSFNEYVDDFVEDLGSISDKYKYKLVIGRPKKWKERLTTSFSEVPQSVNDMFQENSLDDPQEQKLSELLISLLTGSINDINRVGIDVPQTLLEKVKQRILLFDGEQTRFIYDYDEGKRITIQGLSGTGKTELLLHKLKEIYLKESESRIMLTCHNRILAEKLRTRIPSFFNFMKVEEQIKWYERLWCVHAWGSLSDKDSGAYRNICDFYDLQFYRYSRSMSFDRACLLAIEELTVSEGVKKKGFVYDHVLLDESQDFPDSFIELCQMASKDKVFVAGDIFQSIFDENIVSSVSPNFLLRKCYRTDPKTLMFSHAVGMGLFEKTPLRWLDDEEWEKCGYIVDHSQSADEVELSREPLRRFDDLGEKMPESVLLINTDGYEGEDCVIECIKNIQNNNFGVAPDDIGIIFIGHDKDGYDLADRLEYSIPRIFNWPVNKAYETKASLPNHLFISNKNNVKGLEFPFVICVSDKIRNGLNYRNALYMMLTRSFLQTYFLVPRNSNTEIFDQFKYGLDQINEKNSMQVRVPSPEEQERIKTRIQHVGKNQSYDEFIESIFEELHIPSMWRKPLYDSTKSIIGDNFDRENAREIVSFNFGKMEG